jgi:hypothetical protein
MDLDQRRAAQAAFAEDVRVMVSTEAGGEGINLQFCHVVVNLDLPWSPMKIEQRIGRVDRIGQKHVVRAFNFALEDTVELRVREVLEQKLQVIFEEFGVDKLSDVLDSEDAEIDFDRLYVGAMLDPAHAEATADRFADELRQRALAARQGLRVLGASGQPGTAAARHIENHQLPFWTERMTIGFLRSREGEGAAAIRQDSGYDLHWPDGTSHRNATFLRGGELDGSTRLSLEEPRVRALVERLPIVAPGEPIPAVEIAGISDKVSGVWGLWEIALETAAGRDVRVLPIFVSSDDKVLLPTARAIWDRVIEQDAEAITFRPAFILGPDAAAAYERSRNAAEEHGAAVYYDLAAAHAKHLVRERAKYAEAESARRRAIARIGLPQVRQYRLAQLERDREEWDRQLAANEQAVPDLSAVVLVRVCSAGELHDT